MLAPSAQTWRLLSAAPPREVFAVMEQMIGTAPYRYEVVGESEARIIEHRRRGLFGQWGRPRVRIRWVRCRAVTTTEGTWVEVEASSGGGIISKAMGKADRGPSTRALQVIRLLTAGAADSRTLYRERRIPPGPVTLVASWAGMPYRLFLEPRHDAPRGREILTATEVEALPERSGPFVKVRVAGADDGWVESDQIVPAPAVSTRAAQIETARFT
ncbi:MAG: hypothetical protein ACHQ4F_02900 [Candidatus Dormibacteria bacterium]